MEAREPVILEGTVHMIMYSLDQHDRTLHLVDVELDDNEGTLEEFLQDYQGRRVRLTSEELDENLK